MRIGLVNNQAEKYSFSSKIWYDYYSFVDYTEDKEMKTIEEINEKIKSGKAVVLTAEEVVKMAKDEGIRETARKVDVVTTGTFSPMCSSGAFLNFGHTDTLMRMSRITLNDVPAYAGLAAVDCYMGATELSNSRGLSYGGAHVIEDLISGKSVHLHAWSYGTDCYPLREFETDIRLEDMNQCMLFNPRNAYQNYNCAVNTSDRTIHTYMGALLPRIGNANYATSGELSPLLKDPDLRTIGIGTRIFLGGTEGYVAWEGTQCFPGVTEYEDGKKAHGGATIAVIGDLKKMSPEYLRAAAVYKYGVSMFVGIGIPIPVLDEDLMAQLAVSNAELYTDITDYSVTNRNHPVLGHVSFEELRSGEITINGKKVPTAPMSSLKKAREIAAVLKERVQNGSFLLTERVAPLDCTTTKHVLDVRKYED